MKRQVSRNSDDLALAVVRVCRPDRPIAQAGVQWVAVDRRVRPTGERYPQESRVQSNAGGLDFLRDLAYGDRARTT